MDLNLAYVPEIYPMAHENPRVFSCISSQSFWSLLFNALGGVGLHQYIRGGARNWPECGLGELRVFPHGLRDMGTIRLGLLILNEYRCRIVDILTRSVYNIGWCIIGRQTIWWKGMLALNLNIIGPTCIFRCLAS